MSGGPLAEALALAEQLAQSLEESIDAEYGMRDGQKALHPVEARRYARDMREVTDARRKIAALRERHAVPA